MSIASPKSRDELRQYIMTKLGAPVLQINVAEEQMDIAINDAFQYWNERSHCYGTERVYLTTRMTQEFIANFASKDVEYVNQTGGPDAYAAGMVDTVQLVSPGSGYKPSGAPMTNAATTNVKTDHMEIQTQAGSDIQTQAAVNIVYETSGTGTGTGLSLSVGPERTTSHGLVTASVYGTGTGYNVGDMVTVNGSSTEGTISPDPSIWEVKTIKTTSPVYGKAAIERQNNYLVLPDSVVGVQQVMQGGGGFDMAGIFPGGSLFPVMLGGMLGDDFACSGMGYNLVSYVAMMEYMATMKFLFFPPIQYDFNPRTHRVWIDSNNFAKAGAYDGAGAARYLCLECIVAPDPDIYPDCYNDLWLKEYATALVKAQWGRNLTKYNQVQMPGGITLNGAQILTDAQTEVKELRERFAMDWADPALDVVG